MEQLIADHSGFQHTVKKEIAISGAGIHTGRPVNMTIKPSGTNTGIYFKRIDLPGQPTVKADVDNVVDTLRSTNIEAKGARINTIEHLMAALTGMGVDNVVIELDGDEVPILDGSAYPFVKALQEAGIEKQDAEKVYYTLEDNIIFTDAEKNVEMIAIPDKEYRINTLIDFNSSVLGTQHATLGNIKEFNNEIASSRTFCFFHELELLIDNDLIKGGDINNAIVVVDKPVSEESIKRVSKIFNKTDVHVTEGGILDNLELRYPNEPARHKLLDVVGDLALVGYNFKGHIIANRPGHSSNVQFAKKIKEYIKKNKGLNDVPKYDPSIPPVMDVQEIENTLPHRYPFLMVDKVIEMGEKHIVAIKNVTYNEPYFVGHFPGQAIMPGVLQAEALAQTGGLLVIPRNTEDKYDTYFLKIENCKFRQKVVPGDTMILKMELLNPVKRGICEMKGTVYVGNKVVTEAILIAQIVKRPKA
jgi:UDP-3-O-[3-hydroxymyristoyl] N-acetylglucosamine deacetylase / 3-hydroxyacyl-[acyl-carrier-protein] dehydratase